VGDSVSHSPVEVVWRDQRNG